MIPHNTIERIKMTFNGPDAIISQSYREIKSKDMYKSDGTPHDDGIYSLFLGTIESSLNCVVCGAGRLSCPGHDGHIRLKYPVFNPLVFNEIKKWVKLICFNCFGPMISADKYSKWMPYSHRFEEAVKAAKSRRVKGREELKICENCGVEHPLIESDKYNKLIIKSISGGKEEILYPHIIWCILNKITDATIADFGISPRSHPRGYVLDIIKVPSVVIRPNSKRVGKKSSNDPLTTFYQLLIKLNEQIPPDTIAMAHLNSELEKRVYELNSAYFNMIKGGGSIKLSYRSTVEPDSIARKLKGKFGLIRRFQLGKRVFNIARSTITNDATLEIDQLGFPIAFAQILQMEETVTENNRERLLVYLNNGRGVYPSASKVRKASNSAVYNFDVNKHELEIGDVVYRDMIDGDPVYFNRAPSLEISNLSAMRAVILRDRNSHTFRINVLICSFFNADFDGDQMNGIVLVSESGRFEMSELGGAKNWLISYSNGLPALGQTYDSVIGLFELTRNNVAMDRAHAMQLLTNVKNPPILPERGSLPDGKFSGRDIISLLLAETPINLRRKPLYYQENMAHVLEFDPVERLVVIENGKMTSGVLDKKTIGADQANGIYHILANEYGVQRTMDIMFNMQQVSINYMGWYGGTIGIGDIVLPMETKLEIDRIINEIRMKSAEITNRLNRGDIRPPIGRTVDSFYEEEQSNLLSIQSDFNEPILRALEPEANNLYKLVASGSKGKTEHMFNIMSVNGQKNINGARSDLKFGFRRSLVYFPRYSTVPESRGFIANSYLAGMNSVEFIWASMNARFDLIVKALSTAETGEQNRKSIKNLESIHVNNYYWSMKGYNIVQLTCCANYIDPRKNINVDFPTVMISTAALRERYYYATSSDVSPWRSAFDEEFARIVKDRERYRKLFLKTEYWEEVQIMSAERALPIDPARVLHNLVTKIADEKIVLEMPDDETCAKMSARVDEFCRALPYVIFNERARARGVVVPDFVVETVWLMQMAIRTYLCTRALRTNKINPILLENLLMQIYQRYLAALVDPGRAIGNIAAQAFSGPLTQNMLDSHHKSAEGGTKKSGMLLVKEVLGARPVEKLDSPMMLIWIRDEFSRDKSAVQEIANNIENLYLKQFVHSWQIFYEQFGFPEHPKYKHEAAIIEKFKKMNPLVAPPTNLIKWCIRLQLSKSSLILKNMSIEYIVMKLNKLYKDLYIVYTPENSPLIVIRIYIRASMHQFKKGARADNMKDFVDRLLDSNIRGIEGIINTEVIKVPRSEIGTDGSISLNKEPIYAIRTLGTNLARVLLNKYVDSERTTTTAIQEIAAVFGVDAARRKIIVMLKSFVNKCSYQNLSIYGDEMSYNGRITSIERGGLANRENSNILLRMGFSSPIQTIEESALHEREERVSGITAPLLLGDIPKIGTLYNQVCVNEEIVKKYIRTVDMELSEL